MLICVTDSGLVQTEGNGGASLGPVHARPVRPASREVRLAYSTIFDLKILNISLGGCGNRDRVHDRRAASGLLALFFAFAGARWCRVWHKRLDGAKPLGETATQGGGSGWISRAFKRRNTG